MYWLSENGNIVTGHVTNIKVHQRNLFKLHYFILKLHEIRK